jgi:uncharacterized protein YaiI (UPF0178 family)
VRILVDADGCPVKEEIFKVAKRCDVEVVLVANTGHFLPKGGRVQSVVVGQGLDAADDWIVENAKGDDIVVTTDVPLAARCARAVAVVLRPDGKRFGEEDVGSALAMRDLMAQLREAGERTRGPAPFNERDRSTFLQSLDAAIQKARRSR